MSQTRAGIRAIAGTAAITAVAAIAGGCATGRGTPPPPTAEEQIVTFLTGTFSSAAQAQGDPRYQDVTLRATPIWTDRTDARWIYAEQALASDPQRPYRQRIYRLARADASTIESMVLAIPGDPLRYAGAWRERRPLDDLTPELLEPMSGCVVEFRQIGPSVFQGRTSGTGCASSRDGAAYTTSEVVLRADSIESWDRGFDSTNRQVWGPSAGPYRFTRLSASPAAALPGGAVVHAERRPGEPR